MALAKFNLFFEDGVLKAALDFSRKPEEEAMNIEGCFAVINIKTELLKGGNLIKTN